LTIDGFTLRIAIYVDNMLVGDEVTPQDKDLRTTFVADFSKRFDFKVMGTPARFLDMEIAYTSPARAPTTRSARGKRHNLHGLDLARCSHRAHGPDLQLAHGDAGRAGHVDLLNRVRRLRLGHALHEAQCIAYGYSMIKGVSYDQAYMILGPTLIDCDPEVVAYSSPTWRSRASWRKVSMPYNSRMASYEGYITCDGGSACALLAAQDQERTPARRGRDQGQLQVRPARHSTNAFDEK
jgi:hypothetical protein